MSARFSMRSMPVHSSSSYRIVDTVEEAIEARNWA